MIATLLYTAVRQTVAFHRLTPSRDQIFFVDPDTNDPPRLLPGQDALPVYSDVAYSPDGMKMVFSCHMRSASE